MGIGEGGRGSCTARSTNLCWAETTHFRAPTFTADMAESVAIAFPEAAARVVDSFVPKSALHISWDGKEVAEGDETTPTVAQAMPEIRFDGEKDKLYTIIISDPDAPSVAGASWRAVEQLK